MKRKSTKKNAAVTRRISERKQKFYQSPAGKLQILIILFCIAAAWLLWLDYRIHTEFEGSRWTIPARVYARSTDIYSGQQITAGQIENMLRAVNYEPVSVPARPGHFRRDESGLDIYLRAFDYWDGRVSASAVRIDMGPAKVDRIVDAISGKELPVLRLEPGLIGKIYPDHNEDRVLVGYREVPQFLVKALIAAEDQRFYSHYGIDFRSFFRALWVNLRSRSLSQGGSTLTQQLVKNFFLTRERTFTRKINEMIMAVLLERRYEKDEILLAYINEIYLGQHGHRGIHGFGTASEFYFRKPLQELRDDQLALLVALARGASYYNPARYPQRAISRRNLVLDLMTEQAYLDKGKKAKLEKLPLDISERPAWGQSKYPAFTDLLKRQLLRDYRPGDLKNEGLRIFTTLDQELQSRTADIINRVLQRLEKHHGLPPGSLETAVISIDTATGEVLALHGSRHARLAGFNRALDARRQIGSLIKPFVYLAALSQPGRYHLLSVLQDEAISLRQPDGSAWQPGNYNGEFHGNVSLMESIVQSYNLATVRLGLDTGLEKIHDTLQRAGLDSAIDIYPSLLLGAIELSPLAVTQLYQTMANGGYYTPLNTIGEVLDKEGRPLARNSLQVELALEQEPVYLTNYLLTKVVELGTARQLKQLLTAGQLVAGKTGTTNDSRDSWFAGYDDEVLTVVWLGRDDNRPTPFSGAGGAMLIWAEITKSGPVRPLKLPVPEGIKWTGEVDLEFAGRCARFHRLPYVAGAGVPENKLPCRNETNPAKFRFNPFNWFQ